MKGVYIHIPFCRSICSYCDFCKMLYNPKWADKYLSVLEEEIENYYENEVIDTIYIGGGTPSSLNITQLEKLFEIIKKINLNKIYEMTFEANIDDINEEILEILKKNKVNRISIGVESFTPENLKFLNRKHNKKDIFNKIDLVKKHGFENINVDLIYALPIENLNTLKYDVKNILKLNVHHISTYSLIIEQNTVLDIKKIRPIDEEEDLKMYNYIKRKLKTHGYNHYEISNFARPGFESEHNLKYWNNEEYFGFGLGASGYVNGVRYENTRNLEKYLKGKFRKEELFVSKRESMENEVMLGLRKIEGIDIKNFFDKYQVNIQDEFNIVENIKLGYLVLNGKMIKIPESKIYIMNEILNKVIS